MSAPGPGGRWVEGGARSTEERAAAALLARAGQAEAPDPVAQRRSWRGVTARLRRPRRPAPLVIGVAAAVVAAALALVLARPPASPGPTPPARLAGGSGEVQVSLAGAAWAPAAEGLGLPPGSRLRAAADGASAAAVSVGRASVVASEGAELTVLAVGPETVLGLGGGVLAAEVAPRAPGELFAVQTARYRVTVKGTVFSVRERSPADVEVAVRQGLVEVSGQGGRWQVPAGRRWASLEPDRLADLPATALAHRAGLPGSPGAVAAAGGPLEPASSPAPREVAPPAAEDPPPRPARSAARERPPAPAPVQAPPREPAPTPAGLFPVPTPPLEGAPGAAAPLAGPPRPLHRELLARAAPGPAPAGQAGPEDGPYARAVALAAEGRLPEAEAALEAVASAGGPHAELALYELGRLQQVRLGQPARARATYRRYRQEHPRGAMVQEVELSTLELQLQARELDAALATVDGFLRSHPGSERVDELRVLRGDLLRERGDCAGALGEFEQVRAGPQADDATYLAGWCQQRLGRFEAAAATWRSYLARFPAGRHRAEARTGLGEAPTEKE